MTISRPSPSELDPNVIEQAIHGGCRTAFIRLYHHYEGKVRYGVARAALKSGRNGSVEELLQEVWCRFMSNDRRLLGFYDRTRGSFGPFIGHVAYQQALYVLNLQRYKARMDGLPDDGDSLADEESMRFAAEVIQQDLFQKLLERIDAELGDSDRLLLQEHYLGDRTLRDVADELGITEYAIYQRNSRLKKKLERIAQRLLPPSDRPSNRPSGPPKPVLSLVVLTLLAQRHGDRDTQGARSPGAASGSAHIGLENR